MTVSDWAIVIATLLGPVLAIQAQAFLERRRAEKNRRLNVFYALMRTRATPIAPEAVNALNAVPLEFYKLPKIVEAYRAFIKHIVSPQQPNPQGWADRRVDLLMDLIHKIALEVGYKFSVAELKAEFYAPQGHRVIEEEQTVIRQGLVSILTGKAAFPMDVKGFPVDPEVHAGYKAIVTGEKAIKAEVTTTRYAP